ncbi:MAG: DUF5666 domain-containing protein [Burkholderiales bacterium]
MNTYSRITLLIVSLVLTSCGGGSGGIADNGGMGGTGVSMGVMTKGSVIVNGVRYEDNSASISIDDDTTKTAAHLQNGMVVSVRGTTDNTGRGGTAQQVSAVIEVRGTVTSKDANSNPQRFEVLGQTVIVDDLTVYSNITFGAIANNTLVEVHGLRDATGDIRATRVEGSEIPVIGQNSITGMTNPSVDEIRGAVSNRTINTFNLGDQVVFIGSATIVPTGATISNGGVVEVHCSRPCIINNQFVATRIEVEDGSNRPGNGQRFEMEGMVSDLTIPILTRALPSSPPPALSFKVAGVSVTTSGSTRYQSGVYEDMTNNIKVEAEGTWNDNTKTLVANKIEFKRSVVRLQGFVTAQNASTFTLNIAGHSVNVEIDSFTDADAALPANNSNTCVQVRGQRKAGPSVVVTAGEIRVNGCGNGGRPVLQAPVEAETPETLITLLEISIDVSNPTDTSDKWVNTADIGISRTEFFNAVVAASSSVGSPLVAGTLVKVIFNENVNTVRQVELED